jgi:hypothetical protein
MLFQGAAANEAKKGNYDKAAGWRAVGRSMDNYDDSRGNGPRPVLSPEDAKYDLNDDGVLDFPERLKAGDYSLDGRYKK